MPTLQKIVGESGASFEVLDTAGETSIKLDGVALSTTPLEGITAGTVTASKAVVVDANKDISEFRIMQANSFIVGVGGAIFSDAGTATATAGAATLNKMSGKVTSEALTTAADATYTLTLTNSTVAASDLVFASVTNGTNTGGVPVIGQVTPGAGSVVITVENEGAVAFNGTVVISFLKVDA